MLEKLFNYNNHPTLSAVYINFGKYFTEIGDFRNALKYILKGLIMELQLDEKLWYFRYKKLDSNKIVSDLDFHIFETFLKSKWDKKVIYFQVKKKLKPF